MPDPLGYELIVPRKIEADKITKIKHLSQIFGWRHMPYHANQALSN